MKIKTPIVAALALTLALGSLPVYAQQTGVVVDRAAVELALTQKTRSDESSREAIRTLLSRDEVKAMAAGMGLDVRRAEGAVGTLEGADLQRVSAQAMVANDLLTGGRTTITISLVALLLIIIIVILVAG